MWVEIGTAGTVVGLVGLIVRYQAGRLDCMKKSLKEKVDIGICNIHYDELKGELDKGSIRFELLIAEQKTVGETLARLDERIQILLDRV